MERAANPAGVATLRMRGDRGFVPQFCHAEACAAVRQGFAGFHAEAADTPEKLAELQTLPARKVLPQTRDGKTTFIYPDPTVCHCLYVGGEPEYHQYQRLRAEQDILDEMPWVRARHGPNDEQMP